jgi:PAS domain S-box-containing protein
MENPCLGCELLAQRDLFDTRQKELHSIPVRNGTPHQNNQNLAASLERFVRLCDAAFEGIIIHEDGKFIESNRQLAKMFGYTLEEIKKLHGLDIFAPESHPMVREKFASGFEGTYRAMGLRKDGSSFPIEIRVKKSVIDGKAVRIAACRDITQQEETERRIAESEKKYRELYDHAQIPLYRTRICDGKLLECNLALVALLGYDSREECLREHCAAEHYVNPDQRRELLEKLKQEKSVSNFEIEFTRRNGSHAWVAITATINLEEGYIEGAQIDITASKVLTQIEKTILTLIMQGKCNKEIALIMNRSVRTIEDHRGDIMRKLGAANLIELAKIGQFLDAEQEK